MTKKNEDNPRDEEEQIILDVGVTKEHNILLYVENLGATVKGDVEF